MSSVSAACAVCSAKSCTNSGANKSSNESNTCATCVGAGKLVDVGVNIAVVVVASITVKLEARRMTAMTNVSPIPEDVDVGTKRT